ncbi:MAG: copper amine oxidase N-terminal domain-containing protein [Peptoniphilus sp.]|nr:copper amine oxidase N-terminal domain-containing protein [Peptoniphilus sp.]
MKKKLTALLLAVAMMFTLSACTSNMKAYIAKSTEVSQWAGSDISGSAEIKVDIQDPETKEKIDFNIPMTVKGVQQGTKSEVEIVYDFSEFSEKLKESGEFEEMELPSKINAKVYFDGETGKVMVNKDTFKAFVMDEDSPFDEIEEEYIALPTGFDEEVPGAAQLSTKALNYMKSAELQADVTNLLETALKGVEIANDMKVEGNKFTYEATIDQLTDDGVKIISGIISNWAETEGLVVEILGKLDMEVTAEELAAIKEIDVEELKSGAEEIKALLAGSKIKSEVEYGEDKVTENVDMTIAIEEFLTMDINIKSEAVKNDDAKVVFPTSVKELTMDEYLNLLVPGLAEMPENFIIVRLNGEEVVFSDQQPVIVEDRTLVPFRALFEQLGAEDITWDEVNRTVRAKYDDKNMVLEIDNTTAIVGDEKITLDVPAQIIGDRTMVPLRFVSENFGYKVNFDNEIEGLYFIDIYNISEEDLQKKLEAPLFEEED